MGEYILTDILHSGRKGIRGEPVQIDGSKYEGLIGCTFVFNVHELSRYHYLYAIVRNHPYYTFWKTSVVLEAAIGENKKGERVLIVETVNTIYQFKETKNE